MNKVYGGTPIHSESQCTTCRFAVINRGLADSSEKVYCRYLQGTGRPVEIPNQPIVACNSYDDGRLPSRWDMEQIAWVLVTNSAGKAIGFVSAEDFKDKKRTAGIQAPSK